MMSFDYNLQHVYWRVILGISSKRGYDDGATAWQGAAACGSVAAGAAAFA